jgi:hypothetical protein
MGIGIKVVTLKNPCSACIIINGLIKEMLEDMAQEMEGFEIKYIELEDTRNLHSIEGLEVEKFPAIIINGEQITAGNIPDEEYLKNWLRMEG